MAVTWLTAFLDTVASDASAVEAYWVGVTGWPLSQRRGDDGEFATLQPPVGDSPLKLQVVGSPPPNGMHLDVHTDDVERLTTEAQQLGASLRSTGLGYATGRSPGGLTFCVVGHTAGQRPAPVQWPGGTSLVDQVCLDIPATRFDTEAEFWAALTGWPRVQGSAPEFERLVRPPGQPLRILLQRTQEGPDAALGMHLDLSSEDRDAETERHLSLGGRVFRRTSGWTVLLDPSGRAYCVTGRNPATGTLP